MTDPAKQLARVRRWQVINLAWFLISSLVSVLLALPAWLAARSMK